VSRADDIRRAHGTPAGKSRIEQESAAYRDRTARQVAKRLRALVAESAGGDGELDELGLETLAAKVAALVALDPANNRALMRELLPAYVAQHMRER
jgi:hypothetical protein